uniref:Uncharacterized protein n=1 Tax=Prymnesium polylepis TaxID=72548 RepID=A0A6V4E052_9EUKA|mmetsp:Transcript_58361/g.160204  ORF Transcript_58361/g.160204 Transcript_58361/m.160204 type:complete len:256 (-) Transcript_58361:52-819(-)
MDRPATAFATCGIMARPAGVAGIMASGPVSISNAYTGTALEKGTMGFEHALRRHAPYAEVAPPQWYAREAGVHPHQANTAAGVVSAGSIDNTYLPSPLQNSWGKARELARREVPSTLGLSQATDLLVVSKGALMPPPKMAVADMNTVRDPYSKTIPLFHPIEPQRTETGFIRPPNIIPGARPPPVSALRGTHNFELPNTWHFQKMEYDKTALGISKIPVSKVVNLSPPRPMTTQPMFQSMPAGLPGGTWLARPGK